MSSLKKIWKHRTEIMEGIKNSIIRDKFVEKVAAKRQESCNSCVRKDNEGKSCLVPGTQPCCSLCGCSLHFKLRSLSTECPDMRWGALINEEDEQQLAELE